MRRACEKESQAFDSVFERKDYTSLSLVLRAAREKSLAASWCCVEDSLRFDLLNSEAAFRA